MPVTAVVLSARTGTDGNDADAAVARVTIVLCGETIVIEGLTSRANTSCRPNGTVAKHSESSVARLAVGDTTLLNVNQPLTIDLSPLVEVELNKETRTSNSVTRQAAVITTPLGEIVVATRPGASPFTGAASARRDCRRGLGSEPRRCRPPGPGRRG